MVSVEVLTRDTGSPTAPWSRRVRFGFVPTLLALVAATLLLRALLMRDALLEACQLFDEPCSNYTLPRILSAEVRGWTAWIPQHLGAVGLALACARGRRPLLFAAPVAAFVMLPVIAGGEPSALLTPWYAAFEGSRLAALGGALVVAALAAGPAAFVVWQRRHEEAVATPFHPLVTAVGLGLLAMLVVTRGSTTAIPFDHPSTAAVVASFGLGYLGSRRRALIPLFAIIPVALSWNDGSWHTSDPSSVTALAWAFTAVLLGLATAASERRMHAAPLSATALLVVVNALNVVDAVATQLALDAGNATEANPVVRVIGLPAKVVGVGIVSAVLAKWRPRALVVPAAVLLLVAAWHLSGLLTNR